MHPTLPLLLSSSDDMLIKLWDWEKVQPPCSCQRFRPVQHRSGEVMRIDRNACP